MYYVPFFISNCSLKWKQGGPDCNKFDYLHCLLNIRVHIYNYECVRRSSFSSRGNHWSPMVAIGNLWWPLVPIGIIYLMAQGPLVPTCISATNVNHQWEKSERTLYWKIYTKRRLKINDVFKHRVLRQLKLRHILVHVYLINQLLYISKICY